MSLKLKAHIEDNLSITFYESDSFSINYLEAYQNKDVIVTISKATKANTRTNSQNNYYWGVVIVMISNYLGYSREETHDALRLLFLGKEGLINTTKSTTDLTTKEFINYIEQITNWAKEFLNLRIPSPDNLEEYYESI